MKKIDFKQTKTNIKVSEIMKEINSCIKLRKELGVYDHHDFSRLTQINLQKISDKDLYLSEHLKALKNSWAVDINDFEILTKQSGILRILEVLLKKVIWKMLKFYTYRLFVQQREYNFQLSNAVHNINNLYSSKIDELNSLLIQLKKKKQAK
ncbi:MAG: hypothetical protein ACD_79C00726G0001 [uncultured bacterium]|nr:MAG: hypothetical protein ACD_79C00726G0001 [uncultured bacterium]